MKKSKKSVAFNIDIYELEKFEKKWLTDGRITCIILDVREEQKTS